MSFVSLNAQLEGVFGYKLFSSVREAATPYDTSTRHTHRLFLSLSPTPPPRSLSHTHEPGGPRQQRCHRRRRLFASKSHLSPPTTLSPVLKPPPPPLSPFLDPAAARLTGRLAGAGCTGPAPGPNRAGPAVDSRRGEGTCAHDHPPAEAQPFQTRPCVAPQTIAAVLEAARLGPSLSSPPSLPWRKRRRRWRSSLARESGTGLYRVSAAPP